MSKKLLLDPHSFNLLTFTRTALAVLEREGWTRKEAIESFWTPNRVYASRQRPGQYYVVCGNLALIGVPLGRRFHVITLIRNGSTAPQTVAA